MPHRVNVLLGSEWPIGILYRSHTCVLAGQQIQDVVLTLVQRRRRWTNVEPTLIQRLLMSGVLLCTCLWDRLTIQTNTHTLDNHMQPALFQCWHTAYDGGQTFGQRCRIRPTINDRCTSQQTRAVDPTDQHSNNFES